MSLLAKKLTLQSTHVMLDQVTVIYLYELLKCLMKLLILNFIGTLSVTLDGPAKVSLDCTEIENGYKAR